MGLAVPRSGRIWLFGVNTTKHNIVIHKKQIQPWNLRNSKCLENKHTQYRTKITKHSWGKKIPNSSVWKEWSISEMLKPKHYKQLGFYHLFLKERERQIEEKEVRTREFFKLWNKSKWRNLNSSNSIRSICMSTPNHDSGRDEWYRSPHSPKTDLDRSSGLHSPNSKGTQRDRERTLRVVFFRPWAKIFGFFSF